MSKKFITSFLFLCIFSENNNQTCQNKGISNRFCLFNEANGCVLNKIEYLCKGVRNKVRNHAFSDRLASRGCTKFRNHQMYLQ